MEDGSEALVTHCDQFGNYINKITREYSDFDSGIGIQKLDLQWYRQFVLFMGYFSDYTA